MVWFLIRHMQIMRANTHNQSFDPCALWLLGQINIGEKSGVELPDFFYTCRSIQPLPHPQTSPRQSDD